MMEPLFSIKPLGNDSPGIDGTAPRFKSRYLNFKASINKIAPRFNNHVSNCIKLNYKSRRDFIINSKMQSHVS
jgi:hypothetical protein